MEFPFGHHSHHHHHHQRNDQDEERQERPPPPYHSPSPPPYEQPPPSQYYGQNEFAPPPPPRPSPYYREDEFAPPPPRPSPYYQEDEFAQPPSRPPPYYQEPDYSPPPPPPTYASHMHHSSDQQEFNAFDYQPPPPPVAEVTHVAHEVNQEASHHSFRPHMPSFFHHESSYTGSDFSSKPTVKIYCKARPDFSLTIRDDKVILAPSDPSDEFQHWVKDEKFSTKVKDEEGSPCFSLVNKATGQAMKHSVGDGHPVQLIPYNSDRLDESILWTESKVLEDGYRAVRMVNNVHLNVDAFHGDQHSGGVHDGTIIVLWKWNKGDNQRWKIIPY